MQSIHKMFCYQKTDYFCIFIFDNNNLLYIFWLKII